MDKLVSVIMPAYNAALHIAESIESVRAQIYPHWELIIVDDGSTDNTSIIVKQYSILDQRIRYLYQENARQGKARNNGIAHAKGTYVAFLDSDDLWLEEKLAIQIQDLESANADLVFCDAYLFSEKFDRKVPYSRMHTQSRIYQGEEGLSIFLENNRVPILTVVCRVDAIKRVGGFIETRSIQNAEDYHLWLLMLINGLLLRGFNYTLAAYRQHNASVSDADGMNLRQVIEAKVDLATRSHEKRRLIEDSIRYTVRQSLGQLPALPTTEAFETLERYIQVVQKEQYQPLFVGLRILGNVRLAVRVAYFVINYL